MHWQTTAMSPTEMPELKPLPRPDIGTDLLLDERVETDEPDVAHIVKVDPGESAAAKVLEARVMGTPIEALCGFVWVPARDPKQLPVCEACKEVYNMFKIFNDGLNDAPSD